MIEEAQETPQQTNGAPVAPRRGKRRAAKPKKAEVREPQRIGIELSDAVSAALDEFLAAHPKVPRLVAREAVREEGRRAAEEALAGDGKIGELVAKALLG